MRKLIAITQLSLDGVMQGPGGPQEDPRNGFTRGGWAMRFGDEAIEKALNDTVAGEFDLLLGRWTYNLFAGYWPKQGDNPVTKGFDRATKHVVTNSGSSLDWAPSKAITGDALASVRNLKASAGPEIHIWGSHTLLQALMGAGLVDEHRLWIAPVVLGQGKRLFEAGLPPRDLALVETARTPKGVLLNTYRAA